MSFYLSVTPIIVLMSIFRDASNCYLVLFILQQIRIAEIECKSQKFHFEVTFQPKLNTISLLYLEKFSQWWMGTLQAGQSRTGGGGATEATEKILGTRTPFLSEEYHNIAFLSHPSDAKIQIQSDSDTRLKRPRRSNGL